MQGCRWRAGAGKEVGQVGCHCTRFRTCMLCENMCRQLLLSRLGFGASVKGTYSAHDGELFGGRQENTAADIAGGKAVAAAGRTASVQVERVVTYAGIRHMFADSRHEGWEIVRRVRWRHLEEIIGGGKGLEASGVAWEE